MPSDRLVHIVDDDQAIRDSLYFLLATSGIEARTYDSAERFLDSLAAETAGCVISDVRMPGIGGLELVKRLRSAGARLPVIMITGHGDITLAVEAMKLGAADFIEKPVEEQRLLQAIRTAFEARQDVQARDAETELAKAKLAALSGRERDVLDGLVAGKINKTIAYELGISPRTVEIYRANLMSKMGATSLSDLVRTAILAGRGEKLPR